MKTYNGSFEFNMKVISKGLLRLANGSGKRLTVHILIRFILLTGKKFQILSEKRYGTKTVSNSDPLHLIETEYVKSIYTHKRIYRVTLNQLFFLHFLMVKKNSYFVQTSSNMKFYISD